MDGRVKHGPVPNGTYLILITLAAIGMLPALSPAVGMESLKLIESMQFRVGDALSFIAVVIGFGAMIGRFEEHSGGGRVPADWLL